jgi:adenylate cyclase, class 2
MGIVNIEFKAKVNDIESLEAKLISLNPRYVGEDNQKDSYYDVNVGRLKLREGNIENALIWYNRENISGVKQSDILLYKHAPDEALKSILEKIHGIKVIVDKKRKIYFVDNVKIHFDRVEGLGTFIEVEAIDTDETIGIDKLKVQCDFYISFFCITKEQFVRVSYSDMILAYNTNK